ncbi:hypothetical protein Rhal01_00027 [Rubritalea halochordaticola]|uniref:Organic solvent tolerance-like N-terminal domain-containing protein n=1 Tax=Rubritalea halochordaticola TaxID=714537 RepID=A0ABP9UTZ4_9BACT
MRKFLIIPASLYLLLPCYAEDNVEKEEETADALPALKILPEGSTLSNVRVPRYTADYKPASLLHAEQLTVLSDHAVAGTNVDITIFEDDGSIRANTLLKSVTYDQQTGIIQSGDNLTLSGENLDAACQGVVLNWEKRKGFLLGNTQTLLYINKAKQMTSSTKEQSSPKTTKTSKMAAASVALAASTFPAPLTANQLEQIDVLARPATEHIQQADEKANSIISSSQESSRTVDSAMAEFQQEVGEKALLVQNTEKPADIQPKEEAEFVTVKSDNGMYFDAEAGHIVYSKNIVVTHPQYTLTCSDELKIILKKAPADKQTGDKPTNKDPKTEDKSGPLDLNPGSSFDGVEQAIATGNVVVKGKDSDGKPVTAKAATAVYKGDGTIILKGGSPTITQGSNMGKVTDKDGYIIIYPNMSIRFHGSHELKANVKDLQNNPEKP